MSVDWVSEFKTLFAACDVVTKSSDLNEFLSQHRGMYEAAWFGLCAHHKVSLPLPEPQPLALDGVSRWARLRVARLLVKQAPQHLHTFESHMDTFREKGGLPAMKLLERRFGPEPSSSAPFSLLERALVAALVNKRSDTLGLVRSSMNNANMLTERQTFGEMLSLVGGEVLWEEVADPRDFRQRLRRLFLEYKPTMVPQIDVILSEAVHPVALLAMLQMRLGPEPLLSGEVEGGLRLRSTSSFSEGSREDNTEADEEAGDDAATDHHRAGKTSAASPGGAADASNSASNIQAQIHMLESRRDDIFLMPKISLPHPRLEVTEKVRKLLVMDEHISESATRRLTSSIFKVLDRSLHGITADIVHRRFAGDIDESLEWLSFLDYAYVNAEPPSDEPTLRTVASLQVLMYGLEEIFEVARAGGIEQFLIQNEDLALEMAQRMRVTHGRPTEEQLAEKYRRRVYFAYYNKNVPLRRLDEAIAKKIRDNPNIHWYTLFGEDFGPEPSPLAVDVDRVKNILLRWAPGKVNNWETVVDAHTDVGETAEDVIKKIATTYGRERCRLDERIEKEIIGPEIDRRFALFAAEKRTRDILFRFLTTSSTGTEKSIAERQEARATAHKLQMQRLLIEKNAEEERKRREQQETDARTQRDRIITDVNTEEYYGRTAIHEEEILEYDLLMARFPQIYTLFPFEEEQCHPLVGEQIMRRVLCEEAAFDRASIKEAMKTERQNLEIFLADRLLWRKKWERDDEILQSWLRIKDFKGVRDREQKEEKERRDRLAAQKNAVIAHSAEHQAKVKALYDELTKQTVHNLNFQVEVENLRVQYRAERAAGRKPSLAGQFPNIPVKTVHPPHEGCVFADKNYFSASTGPKKSYLDPIPPQAPNPFMAHAPSTGPTGRVDTLEKQDLSDDVVDDTELVFLDQLYEYMRGLFKKYDPKNVGREKELLRQFEGSEARLVSALEQQYNVDHWMSDQLFERVTTYYRLMAAEYMDEIPGVMQRFIGNEEAMWAYLTDRHGPVPNLLPRSLQLYVRSRLIKYFTARAPHMLGDIDRLTIIVGSANGQKVFKEMQKAYGPEAPQQEMEFLSRRLRRFFRERNITRQFDDIPVLARRFLGHEPRLNALLQSKFGDSLEGKLPYVDDYMLFEQ